MYSDEITKNITEGSKLYAAKDYDQAASKYADACAAYNEENGEDDADLLLLYGKALYQNGVAKSGVLGQMSGDQTKDQAEEKEKDAKDEGEDNDNFQFEEGYGDDENDDGNEEQAGDEGEEQSDFEAGWEILDLARALFAHKVELLESEAKDLATPYLKTDDEEPTSDYVIALKKLSETYDLLGEVSLESENFTQAASDLESCLELRLKLYNSKLSPLVSESHYKLSLALEFCVEDPTLRKKAADQMKLAIDCVKARAATQEDEEAKKDSQELLRDLEERYKELKKDPQQDVQAQQMDIIKGLLGEAVGSAGVTDLSSLVKKAPVNDLSSMVKKRKAKPEQKETKKPRSE